jgi:predicted ester cyclase
MLEDNKALVRRFIDEIINAGNVSAIHEFCPKDSMFAGGIAGQIQSQKITMPDIHYAIVEMIAEGETVAVRMTSTGTNTGPLVGLPAFGKLENPIPPTGKTVTATMMYFFKVIDGKIVSLSFELDQISLLRQMGWTFAPPENN